MVLVMLHVHRLGLQLPGSASKTFGGLMDKRRVIAVSDAQDCERPPEAHHSLLEMFAVGLELGEPEPVDPERRRRRRRVEAFRERAAALAQQEAKGQRREEERRVRRERPIDHLEGEGWRDRAAAGQPERRLAIGQQAQVLDRHVRAACRDAHVGERLL